MDCYASQVMLLDLHEEESTMHCQSLTPAEFAVCDTPMLHNFEDTLLVNPALCVIHQILDPAFSHQFKCTTGRAAMRPHRRQLMLHFANVLKKFPDKLAVGVDAAEEMTVHQWLTFCEVQKIFCDKVLSPAKAALIFVQVYDDHVFQAAMMEHAIDVNTAMAIAQAHEKKDVRKDPAISVSEFEECVARCAWSHGLGQRLNTMLDRFVAEKLEILVEAEE
mmetsp:Transcript_5335/g.10076  ORF Transcript_5335/g.10076 Transcript_5335/m.10076 type:complete len:220 (+) Transcript_5335:1-660(+)